MPERPIIPTKSSKDKGKAVMVSSFAGPTYVPTAAPTPNNPQTNPTQKTFRPKLLAVRKQPSSSSQPPPRSDKTAAILVYSPPPPPQKPNETAITLVSTASPPPQPQKHKETTAAMVSTASPSLPSSPLLTMSQIDEKARKRLLRVSALKYPYTGLDSPVCLKRGSGSRDPSGVTPRKNSLPSRKEVDFLSQIEAETLVQVQRENPPNDATLSEWGATLVLGNGKRQRVDLTLRI